MVALHEFLQWKSANIEHENDAISGEHNTDTDWHFGLIDELNWTIYLFIDM